MKGIVNYEGHKFRPDECSGYSYSGSVPGGIWYVLIGTNKEDRSFTTHNCPIKTGGLADQIKKAREELATLKD